MLLCGQLLQLMKMKGMDVDQERLLLAVSKFCSLMEHSSLMSGLLFSCLVIQAATHVGEADTAEAAFKVLKVNKQLRVTASCMFCMEE